MNNETDKLIDIFGLSEYESKVFNVLNEKGALNISQVSTHSKIPRTAVYPPVKSLIKKGFVSETSFGKRKYYSAVSLDNLESIFESKRGALGSLLIGLNNSRQISSSKEQLDIQLFIGSEGIKSAGIIFLNETKEKMWYSFENLINVIDEVSLEFEDFYIKERVSKKIKSKMIVSITEESPVLRKILKNDDKQLRESITLSPNEYLFDTTMVATKGLLLLINPKVSPFALLIRNANLANTFTNIHKCVWDRYRQ